MKKMYLLLVLLTLLVLVIPAQADVSLPDDLTRIEAQAFLNDTSLTGTLVIPEGVTEIGPQAFKGCTGLTSVTFPSSLRTISSEAFAGCTNLTGSLFPSDNLTIAADALTGSQIELVQENPASDFTYTIANGEVTITGYAGEEPIGYLVIPEAIEGYPVTAIGESAFQFQQTLTGLSLPRTIKRLDFSAFYHCHNLRGTYYIEGTIDRSVFMESPHATGYGYTINNDQTVTITKCSTGQTEGIIKIPDYIDNRPVTILGDEAIELHWNYTITEIILPSRLKSIGKHCFGGEIGTLTLPATLEYIDEYAFYALSLTSLVLPESVTTIGNYAFAYSDLESITFLNNLDKSGYGLLEECKNLRSVTLSENVTVIPEAMFLDCTALESIVLPNSITHIRRIAFMRSGLTSLVLPDSVKTIADNAFSVAPLKSITFPKQVDFLDYSIVSGCTNLTSVTLPENITAIPMLMFNGCTALESITLPESVTYLDWSAFADTTSLTSINLDNITETHNSVFRGSKLLTDAAARVAARVVQPGMTDFEKAKALHDWVVNNTTYYLNVAGPEGTFFMDGGSCMSYAEAYGLLLDQVGIENLYIEAPVEMEHIWNLIKLDGEWYHVDCTWDDGGDVLSYRYFCLSDELMKQTHSWPYDNYPAATGTRYTNGVDHGE